MLIRRRQCNPARKAPIVGVLLAGVLSSSLLAALPQAPIGKTVPHGPARRIITIAPDAAEIICALGACERIIGVSKYCLFPPELGDRMRVGGLMDPDLERLILLHPDLIVLRGRNEAVERLCRERGIKLYYDETDTLEGIAANVRMLGGLLGREEQAERLIGAFQERVEAVKKRLTGRARPRVLLTAMRSPDRLANVLTPGRGTFLSNMIELAGGTNVFGHLDMRYPQVSMESILAARPEVIIELMPEVDLTPERKASLRRQWQPMGSIPAVAADRIYFVGDAHAMIPSLRYVDIIEKISRLLHPEVDVDR